MSYNSRKRDYPKPYSAYDAFVASFTTADADTSMKDNSTLFDTISVANELRITNGGADISVKMNSTSNAFIRIPANGEFQIDNISIQDIFITASGNTTVDFLTMGWR